MLRRTQTSRQVLMRAALALAFGMLLVGPAAAHPGSGIVADDAGNVYFTYTGRGAAKLDAKGHLDIIFENRGGHWMCLDRAGVFANTQPQFFRRVTPDGAKPAVIYADGGAPLAVSRSGYLFYGANDPASGELPPGGLSVARFKPGGKPEAFAPDLKQAMKAIDEGVTGLAIAPDDSLLVSTPSSIWKVKPDGSVAAVASPVALADCDEDLPPNWKRAGLRGIDAAADGTIYAAATGCRRVLKIRAGGAADVVLKSAAPWTPTGVAVHGDEIYVLEYTHANAGPDRGWRPRVQRVQRVTRDGTATVLFVAPEAPERSPTR